MSVTLESEPLIIPGVEQHTAAEMLGISRDCLRLMFELPGVTNDAFGYRVCEYLNAFNAYHFDGGQSRASIQSDPARILKIEAEYLLGQSIEPMEEVKRRLLEYLEDDQSRYLRQVGYLPMGRACTMTLLDLVHQYKP